MANPQWPKTKDLKLIGKRISRVDGPVKVTGAAKYSLDIKRPGMLYAKVLPSRYAAAKINKIDTSKAKNLKGVKATWVDDAVVSDQVRYGGQMIAAVAAETEEIAQEAIGLINVDYDPLPHQVVDNDPSFAEANPSEKEKGDVDAALDAADVVIEGEYGLECVTHCCLEPHGQVVEIRDGELYVWPSTQSVSKFGTSLARSTGFAQNKIHVDCQYMGGGFGSKLSVDKAAAIGIALAKASGRPVKLLLERDVELMVSGNRPSGFGKLKVGVKKDGSIVGMDADVCGSSGMGSFRAPPIPYVFTEIPNQRLIGRRILTNRGSTRAWRAPNNPQACLMTMGALDDAAAALKMDALEFFLKNLDLTDRPEVYREELLKAADMIGHKDKAHLRGEGGLGPVKRGLGISLHTWGGQGHPSECDVTVFADGSVEVKIGSQDIGTGTRTTIGIVVAETFGLPLEAVDVKLGRNAYPPSGGSGGSTTIGGVSASSRLASTDALNALLEIVAPKLKTTADKLEARDGRIAEKGNPSNSVLWEEACALLGPNSLTKRGENDRSRSQELGLIDKGVGGVQMADVSVDVETGVVTINEMAAVQDCGLVIDRKTAESQVHGGLIMGITYALFEEAVYDVMTGRMLNADMEFYRLAGLGDIGRFKVHLMSGKGYDDRGVIGLGEPPVISPGAAISNAVANACGVRVPDLPLTPDRVLNALNKGGNA